MRAPPSIAGDPREPACIARNALRLPDATSSLTAARLSQGAVVLDAVGRAHCELVDLQGRQPHLLENE